MIFTVGHEAKYDELLTTRVLYKAGRREGYPGGSVFETATDAEAYLAKEGMSEYAVYCVDAEWADTEPGPDYHFLVGDARILKR